MNKDELIELVTHRVINELRRQSNGYSDKKIPIAVSARHVHLTRETFERLYGPGKELTIYTKLYQPGEFASAEVVTLVGPRLRAIQDVRILGPFREYNQVELSYTDGVVLGIDPPVRRSGDLKGSEPIVIVGPAGSVHLTEGAICANRHIHMSPSDAERLGVTNDEIVSVKISGIRALTFENVQVRVSDRYLLQMHLDTDDANAAGVRAGDFGELIKRQ